MLLTSSSTEAPADPNTGLGSEVWAQSRNVCGNLCTPTSASSLLLPAFLIHCQPRLRARWECGYECERPFLASPPMAPWPHLQPEPLHMPDPRCDSLGTPPAAASVTCLAVLPPCPMAAGGCPCPRAKAHRGAIVSVQRLSGLRWGTSGRLMHLLSGHSPDSAAKRQSPAPSSSHAGCTCALSLWPPQPRASHCFGDGRLVKHVVI